MNTTARRKTLAKHPESVHAKRIRIRLYLRQSTKVTQQVESVATQRAEIKRLALQVGITEEQWADRIEYIDIDRSGSDFKGREALTRLLHEAEAGDLIFSWKQNRLGRDAIDGAATVRELVKYRGCVLRTVETGIHPVSMKSAEDAMMIMFRGVKDQGELENTRTATRSGLRNRARDGFATGLLPFGYRTVLVDPNVVDRKKSKKRIEIDEARAAIVRRIFSQYIEGSGSAGIAKALNREGATSPRGKGWSPACIWDMLREASYVGQWSYGEVRVVGREGDKTLTEAAPEEEVIRSERPELAIISRETWAAVQTAIADRKREFGGALTTARHPLSGTLKCGQCGGPMRVKVCHGRRADWQRRYYVCGTRMKAALCTNSVHLPADEVEQALSEHLRSNVLNEIMDKLLEEIRIERQRVIDASNERTSEADCLRAELEVLRKERQRLVRLATATDDPVPEVVAQLRANQERAKLLDRSLALATRPPMEIDVAERLEALARSYVERMRQQLQGSELRAAITALFPKGLRFKVGNGLWLVEGAASVPGINDADGCPAAGRF